MANAVADSALDVIFREARTYSSWTDRPVDDAVLRRIYDLAKMGPTSANTCPMHLVFVKSPAAKERLKPSLMAGNVDKTMDAPVCAIVANDMQFFQLIPRLFPQNPRFADMFTAPGKEDFTRMHAFRNATLQGAYVIMAARRLGTRLRSDVRIRQCQGRRRVFPGRPLQIEFPDQPRLRRLDRALSAKSPARVRRSVQDRIGRTFVAHRCQRQDKSAQTTPL